MLLMIIIKKWVVHVPDFVAVCNIAQSFRYPNKEQMSGTKIKWQMNNISSLSTMNEQNECGWMNEKDNYMIFPLNIYIYRYMDTWLWSLLIVSIIKSGMDHRNN